MRIGGQSTNRVWAFLVVALATGYMTRELEREYRAVVEEILELRGDDGRISAFVRSITAPGALVSFGAQRPLDRPGTKSEGFFLPQGGSRPGRQRGHGVFARERSGCGSRSAPVESHQHERNGRRRVTPLARLGSSAGL